MPSGVTRGRLSLPFAHDKRFALTYIEDAPVEIQSTPLPSPFPTATLLPMHTN